MNVSTIGTVICQERKKQGLTQEQLAAISGVGRRFVGELEAGKPTCQIGKVLKVLDTLGVRMSLSNSLGDVYE